MKIRKELPTGVIEIECSAPEFNLVSEKLLSSSETIEKKEENILSLPNDDHDSKREMIEKSNLSRRAKNLALWMYDHYVLPKHLNAAIENLNTAIIKAENIIKSDDVRENIIDVAEIMKIGHPNGFYVGSYSSNTNVINTFTEVIIDKVFKNVEKFTKILEIRLDDVIYCIMDSLAEIHNKNIM